MPKSRSRKTHQLAKYTSSHRWTAQEAQIVLDAHRASGLSLMEFARRQGFDPQRLYCWRRRLTDQRELAEPSFVEVAAPATAPVEVVLRSGRVLRVSERIDPEALRRLAEALEQDAAR